MTEVQRLTEENLYLVHDTARRYQGRGTPMIDLLNEANLGLVKAAELYVAGSRTVEFTWFAKFYIRQALNGLVDDA